MQPQLPSCDLWLDHEGLDQQLPHTLVKYIHLSQAYSDWGRLRACLFSFESSGRRQASWGSAEASWQEWRSAPPKVTHLLNCLHYEEFGNVITSATN